MGIAERLSKIKEELGCQARLVAVSKTKTAERSWKLIRQVSGFSVRTKFRS